MSFCIGHLQGAVSCAVALLCRADALVCTYNPQGCLQATEDKNAAMAQAEKTSNKAKLADRLISGLSGEFQRWTVTIKELTEAEGRQCSIACVYNSAGNYLER